MEGRWVAMIYVRFEKVSFGSTLNKKYTFILTYTQTTYQILCFTFCKGFLFLHMVFYLSYWHALLCVKLHNLSQTCQ